MFGRIQTLFVVKQKVLIMLPVSNKRFTGQLCSNLVSQWWRAASKYIS